MLDQTANPAPHDAVIIGGSYAGMAAAMQLARARRRVAIIDTGKPRNRFASHAHGVLALDGRPGAEIAALARAQLCAYPGVTFHDDEATAAERGERGFIVRTRAGAALHGRRLILAHGVAEDLPDVKGVAERWGRTALHCPYCHGYELEGGHIGVLATAPHSAHYAMLIADWGDVTLFLNNALELESDIRARLDKRGVRIEATPIDALEGEAPDLSGARLIDGRLVPLKAIFVGARFKSANTLAHDLGCTFEDTPMGAIIATDWLKQTNVPGVFAAGDAARAMTNITLAAADGVMAGIAAHRALVEEESEA